MQPLTRLIRCSNEEWISNSCSKYARQHLNSIAILRHRFLCFHFELLRTSHKSSKTQLFQLSHYWGAPAQGAYFKSSKPKKWRFLAISWKWLEVQRHSWPADVTFTELYRMVQERHGSDQGFGGTSLTVFFHFVLPFLCSSTGYSFWDIEIKFRR